MFARSLHTFGFYHHHYHNDQLLQQALTAFASWPVSRFLATAAVVAGLLRFASLLSPSANACLHALPPSP